MRATIALATFLVALTAPTVSHAEDEEPAPQQKRQAAHMPLATVSVSPDLVLGSLGEAGVGLSLRARVTPFTRQRMSPALVVKVSGDVDTYGERHAAFTTGIDVPVFGDVHQGLTLGPRLAWQQDQRDPWLAGTVRGRTMGGAVVGQTILGSGVTLGGTLDIQVPVGHWPQWGSDAYARMGVDLGAPLGGRGAYKRPGRGQTIALTASLGGTFLTFLAVGALASHCSNNYCTPF